MRNFSLSRRSLFGASAGAAAMTLAACGTSGPGGSGGSGGSGGGNSASIWQLSGQPNEGIYKDSVDAFNELDKGTLDITFFQNDAYKQKIRTAIGAGEAPTVIYGWGGGGLRTYAEEKQVDDLTSWLEENSDFKKGFVDSVWDAATVDDKIYALPIGATQPIIMFSNEKVLDKIGAEAPKTWDDLMDVVEKANSGGAAPISLAGQSRWTSMMWLEYLLDRIGGPEVFANIAAGKKDAWLDDAVVEMGNKVKELLKAKAFADGFESMSADSNTDQALLWSDKAALMLHGGWTYGGMKTSGGDFVSGGHLGYGPFPTIEGGKGKLENLVGNPCNYVSLSSAASKDEKTVAKSYFLDGMMTDDVAAAFVKSGSAPVIQGQEDALAKSDDADYLQWVYTSIQDAPVFTQSWDQALQPTDAENLLVNTEQLFLGKLEPEQFAENMNSGKGA
ncbi:sugar ABC transporter substrate-binding protein [Brachybacterium endophyticum]|uniref:Sugar ABC transporter substrate-binding protein n=1 Tax=Brachybacterium endophyticum TaxID=2182385 RepID=A0A2U2RN14_9MICO|nr:extracellular solute-binding protein [Brachybacterium endophyticum]PWH07260.1 sugar ABC transporter substrate-binding protein [Brachybacterium endophyticum]